MQGEFQQWIPVCLLEKGWLWPVPVLWMGTKALISILLSVFYSNLLGVPLSHDLSFLLLSICSNLFFKGSCLFQESLLVPVAHQGASMVPSTPEPSATQGNLPFPPLLSAHLKCVSLHASSAHGTPLPNEFIMTSEVAGVAGRQALIVFHWFLCSAHRDCICCALGSCRPWAGWV